MESNIKHRVSGLVSILASCALVLCIIVVPQPLQAQADSGSLSLTKSTITCLNGKWTSVALLGVPEGEIPEVSYTSPEGCYLTWDRIPRSATSYSYRFSGAWDISSYDVVFRVGASKISLKIHSLGSFLEDASLSVGQTKPLKIYQQSELEKMGYKFKWSTSNNHVVSVNASTGRVKGVRCGFATITAYDSKSGLKVSGSVTSSGKAGMQAVQRGFRLQRGGLKYSQAKRMASHYADCSSFTWKSYKPQGITMGDKSYAPTAAGQAIYLTNHGKRIATKAIPAYRLQPGDLVFYSTSTYSNMYHVDIYTGGGMLNTVERQKTYWEGNKYVKCICRPTLRKASSVKVGKTNISMKVGTAYSLTSWQTGNGANEMLSYSSSNPKVATVNSVTGRICAKKKGTVTITVKAHSSKKTARCKVTVK